MFDMEPNKRDEWREARSPEDYSSFLFIFFFTLLFRFIFSGFFFIILAWFYIDVFSFFCCCRALHGRYCTSIQRLDAGPVIALTIEYRPG